MRGTTPANVRAIFHTQNKGESLAQEEAFILYSVWSSVNAWLRAIHNMPVLHQCSPTWYHLRQSELRLGFSLLLSLCCLSSLSVCCVCLLCESELVPAWSPSARSRSVCPCPHVCPVCFSLSVGFAYIYWTAQESCGGNEGSVRDLHEIKSLAPIDPNWARQQTTIQTSLFIK